MRREKFQKMVVKNSWLGGSMASRSLPIRTAIVQESNRNF
jgi:hypothetical protein